MESSNIPREERNNKCCYCNAHICSSYVLGMFACVLVVGGVYLAFHKWDYMWLVVSAVGIVLILIGALLHFCGSNPKKKDTRARHTINEQDLHEHLLPTAPPLSNAYSVSQLSINMLPPYFSAVDNVLSSSSFPSAPPNSDNVSQIVQIKGQSFILLPISESVISNDNESVARWNNQSNAPKDQSNGQQGPKAENSSSTVPVTEDCGCQTEVLSLHQITQTSENGIQASVAAQRESCEVQTTPTIEDNSTNESSITNAVLHTEGLHVEATDLANNALDAVMDCSALPVEACNAEILPVMIQDEDSSNSANEIQMEMMESGESTNSLSTNYQTQLSSSQERFSVSTDDSDTAININTFPHDIPSLDNLAQPPLHPSGVDVLSDSIFPVSNNSPSENYSIPVDHMNNNRVNVDGVTVDINENYPEQSIVIDLVNNNDTCDNVGNSHCTQNSEYSVIRDPNDDISVGEQSYPVTALLGINENYIEQYSENVSDIDDADICDRSSPPPSYEEVTQENLVIGRHGIAYHGTL